MGRLRALLVDRGGGHPRQPSEVGDEQPGVEHGRMEAEQMWLAYTGRRSL